MLVKPYKRNFSKNKNGKMRFSYYRLIILIFIFFLSLFFVILVIYKISLFSYFSLINFSNNLSEKYNHKINLENSSTSSSFTTASSLSSSTITSSFTTLSLQSNSANLISAINHTDTEILNLNQIISSNTGIISHITAPEKVRGIYMSSYAASSKMFRENLLKFLENTALNTIVIDVKDNHGDIIWDNKVRMSSTTLRSFIRLLHEKNIYVIARIAVFEDPKFAVENISEAVKNKNGLLWKNKRGLAWVDPASQKMWNYVLDLSKKSYFEFGFDEINFDYIRFPTDGNMENIFFPKSEARFNLKNAPDTAVQKFTKRKVIQNFQEFLNQELSEKEKIKISADLFGMVAVATDDSDIGQTLEDALKNFDYVSPMIYPSHFYAGTLNYKKPDLHPYEIIYYALGNSLLRSYYQEHDWQIATSTYQKITDLQILKKEFEKIKILSEKNAETNTAKNLKDLQKKIRPWYQDFDLNGINYDIHAVSQQIQAGNDLGINSFLLWDAKNKYTRGVDYDKIGQ